MYIYIYNGNKKSQSLQYGLCFIEYINFYTFIWILERGGHVEELK